MSVRIAHIVGGYITNVSLGPDDWTAPGDGSKMLESAALDAGLTYAPSGDSEKPDAPAWKVKVWLVRNGIDPDTQIPAIITAAIPEGPERTEALIRWRDVPLVPFEHPLVAVVAAGLQLDPGAVWDAILAV